MSRVVYKCVIIVPPQNMALKQKNMVKFGVAIEPAENYSTILKIHIKICLNTALHFYPHIHSPIVGSPRIIVGLPPQNMALKCSIC